METFNFMFLFNNIEWRWKTELLTELTHQKGIFPVVLLSFSPTVCPPYKLCRKGNHENEKFRKPYGVCNFIWPEWGCSRVLKRWVSEHCHYENIAIIEKSLLDFKNNNNKKNKTPKQERQKRNKQEVTPRTFDRKEFVDLIVHLSFNPFKTQSCLLACSWDIFRVYLGLHMTALQTQFSNLKG